MGFIEPVVIFSAPSRFSDNGFKDLIENV